MLVEFKFDRNFVASNVFESNESKHTLTSFGARLKITTFDVENETIK